MIELTNVTKKYGQTVALDDVSFAAPDGKIVGLLGKNGAGKSTALNIMTGYFPPDHGTVTVNGTDMLSEPRECKRMIGYLPEKPPLYDEMTVREYLAFVCGLREVVKKSIRPHTDEILELCGLTEMKDRLIGQLSKGYRQRTGVAQALCGSPKIIIMDEPTVGLDPQQVTEIRELIRKLGESHTVIFSSHILSEVQLLCQQVVILNNGRVIRSCNMDALEEDENCMRLELTVRGDEKTVLNALRSLNGIRRIGPAGTLDGTVHTELLCDRTDARGDIREQIFRLLAAMDTPILEMTRGRDTLENWFIKATTDDE